MDSLGFVVNRKFALIAVEKRFEMQRKDAPIVFDNIRKAYKLNDHHLISVIGNYLKMTDMYRYIFRLNELGNNGTFDEIISDLTNVFGTSMSVRRDLADIKQLMLKLSDDPEKLRNELKAFFAEKPHLMNLYMEIIAPIHDPQPALTQVLLFGWDEKLERVRQIHLLAPGNNLIPVGGGEEELLPGALYTRLVSFDIKREKEIRRISEEVNDAITSLLTPEWDDDNKHVDLVIDQAIESLTAAYTSLTPYQAKPDVIFYELSHRTNFKFQEPDVKLMGIQFDWPPDDSE
jgi:hypothetical protein